MSDLTGGFLQRALRGAATRHWARVATTVGTGAPHLLHRQRSEARNLRRHLDRLIRRADLALVPHADRGLDAAHPPGADWAWRPPLWSAPSLVPGLVAPPSRTPFGPDFAIFHDCPDPQMSLRQIRSCARNAPAPFVLQLEVFGFHGTFVSFVIDMPDGAVNGLSSNHVLRAAYRVEVERPVHLRMRMNVRHGPNTEEIWCDMGRDGGDGVCAFDLGYSRLNERRIDKVWLDVMAITPRMNRILLRDLSFSRAARLPL